MRRILLLISTTLLLVGLIGCNTANNDKDKINDNDNIIEDRDDLKDDNLGEEILDGDKEKDMDKDLEDDLDRDDLDRDERDHEDDDKLKKDEEQPTNGQVLESNDDLVKLMEQLNYIEFELEVDYPSDKEYEAEIELKNGVVKAELEDELNNVKLKGVDAFNEIYPKVKELTIEKSTDKNTAIKQALQAFSLDENYKKIEIEITFKDNTEIKFKDRK